MLSRRLRVGKSSWLRHLDNCYPSFVLFSEHSGDITIQVEGKRLFEKHAIAHSAARLY